MIERREEMGKIDWDGMSMIGREDDWERNIDGMRKKGEEMKKGGEKERRVRGR